MIRHVSLGSHCLLGKGSESFESHDCCLLTNYSEMGKFEQL